MVEEAGQVLEAHILASLVDSGQSPRLFLFLAGLSRTKPSPTFDLYRGPQATEAKSGDALSAIFASLYLSVDAHSPR